MVWYCWVVNSALESFIGMFYYYCRYKIIDPQTVTSIMDGPTIVILSYKGSQLNESSSENWAFRLFLLSNSHLIINLSRHRFLNIFNSSKLFKAQSYKSLSKIKTLAKTLVILGIQNANSFGMFKQYNKLGYILGYDN